MLDRDADSDAEPLYFAYSATLRIFGIIPELQELSTVLRLTPTYLHQRGERRGAGIMRNKFDMWSYTAPVPEDRPLDVHIQTLWAHIQPHKTYLKQLQQHLSVDVFCGYRSNASTAGFEVSYPALALFVELEVPFGISVIVT